MSGDEDRAGVVAAGLIRDGRAGDVFVRERAKIVAPVAITGPRAEPAGFMVGLVVGKRLVGFVQLTATLDFLRYASFQRRPGLLAGCPAASSWLDPAVIVARARAVLPTARPAGAPSLTYDGHASRLAWAVPLLLANGDRTTVLVAGDFAYPTKR